MREEMERIYTTIPHDAIPWNVRAPPEVLISLIKKGVVAPCKAIDLGCGAGNYAVYLASEGFDVIGVDISPTAISIARKQATEKGVPCRFLVADVLGDMHEIQETFDFAFDWELLHHIFPEWRKAYVGNVYRLLNPGGRYLSLCFSESDPAFGGSGKYRKTPLGTILYFSSEQELEILFSPHFTIIEMKTIIISGTLVPHHAVYAFMEKK